LLAYLGIKAGLPLNLNPIKVISGTGKSTRYRVTSNPRTLNPQRRE
jgi:hypothetical protein